MMFSFNLVKDRADCAIIKVVILMSFWF